MHLRIRMCRMQKGSMLMSDKTLSDVQREVDVYISQFKEGYFSPLALMARMSEEVGELAREINHYYILFLLACFANSLDIDLTEAHNKVMHKFATRDANRWTKKSTEQ
jgi:NTP pyrophosphatase (non-canonical NTP hydrolase)